MFGKQWTNTEDDFMRKHYSSESNSAICEKLGRSLRSVYSRFYGGSESDSRTGKENAGKCL